MSKTKEADNKSTDLENDEDQDKKKKTGGASDSDAVKPETTIGKSLEKESTASDLPADYSDVSVVYLRPANLKVSGEKTPSGESYEFSPGENKAIGNQPGNVKPEDVEYLLSKNRSKNNACCGATGETIYFVLQPMEV